MAFTLPSPGGQMKKDPRYLGPADIGGAGGPVRRNGMMGSALPSVPGNVQGSPMRAGGGGGLGVGTPPPVIGGGGGGSPTPGDDKFVGPPLIGGGPNDKFVGPPAVGGGANDLFVGPPAVGGGANDKFVGPPLMQGMLPNTPGVGGGMGAPGGLNAPATRPLGETRASGSELLSSLFEGQPEDKLAELKRMQEEDLRRAQGEVARGPIVEGDLTNNPVGFARTYRSLLKQGWSPEDAIGEANRLMAPGTVDRQGRLRNDVIERLVTEYNSPEYERRIMESGFFGDPGQAPTGSSPGSEKFLGPALKDQSSQGQEGYYGQDVAVGEDPFSQGISDAFGQLLSSGGGATTAFGQNTENVLSQLLQSAGQLDPNVISQRTETIEDALNRLEQQRIKSLDARAADRGLIGSGAQKEGLEGISRDIMDIGAGALRDIFANEQEAANSRFIDTAGLATGLTSQQPGNLLSAAMGGTQRQDILSRIALDQLSQQADWSKFLAQFGLDREVAQRELENADLGQIMAVLQALFTTPGIAQRGYI